MRNLNWMTGRTFGPVCVAVVFNLAAAVVGQAAVNGWLNWRGPEQSGVSLETGLPDKIGSKEDALWVADFPGKSTAVIAGGKLYILGFDGEGADLKEEIRCYDAETGELIWKQGYTDYLSDIIYFRVLDVESRDRPRDRQCVYAGHARYIGGLYSGWKTDLEP